MKVCENLVPMKQMIVKQAEEKIDLEFAGLYKNSGENR